MRSGSGIKMKKLKKDKDDKSNVVKICRLDKNGKEMDGTEIEVCGECIDDLLPFHYMYFSGGYCYECGAKQKDNNGNVLKPINKFSKLKREDIPEDSKNYNDDELGQDGFPRKTVLRDKLEDKGIFEGMDFKSLSYVEDVEDESEKKKKNLILVGWNEEKSSYSLEDIEAIINHSEISVKLE
jgi:hypothetical protein